MSPSICSARPSMDRRRRRSSSRLASAGAEALPRKSSASSRCCRPRTARQAWRDYGQIILVDSLDESGRRGGSQRRRARRDTHAPAGYFLERMRNYGSMFLGPETNVAYGDKVIGTNHTLPTTRRRAIYRRALGGQVPEDVHLSASARREASVRGWRVLLATLRARRLRWPRRTGKHPPAPLRWNRRGALHLVS